jgi:hypothetical protein
VQNIISAAAQHYATIASWWCFSATNSLRALWFWPGQSINSAGTDAAIRNRVDKVVDLFLADADPPAQVHSFGASPPCGVPLMRSITPNLPRRQRPNAGAG